ncbi:uncharacterized protein [Fopius arisanus]|uniref:Uncharacterized protein n=1 Tax=Fopius arisanus TaxID=64838 RepID=A0A9R1TPK6_9HYME|nr:PREDICTED: uncharacterized protein LOC105272863 [Fopius arisanus]
MELYSTANALQSYSINLYGTLSLIWKRAFFLYPSAVRQYECPDCGNYTVLVSTLQINHSKVENPHGFEVLRDLQIFNEGSRFACRNSSCRKECKIITQYSNQIFVELDARPKLTCTYGKSEKLKEFPTTLILNDNCYRLAGVIAHRPGDFVAYCLRNMVHWQRHDDLEPRIISCISSTVVVPEAVIYVQCLNKNEMNAHHDTTDTLKHSGHPNDVKEQQCPQNELQTTHLSNDYYEKRSDISPMNNPSEFPRRELPCTIPIEDSDTISRDNWRCKEKRSSLDTDVKEFYTTTNSEDEKSNIESVKLLKSGELLPGVIIEEELLHVSQTSSFDSILHILWCTAINDDSYGLLIKFPTTDNRMLDLIVKLINDENPESVYKNRALILRSLSEVGVCRNTTEVDFGVQSILLTVCGTPADIWKTCLDTEPTEERFYECDACGKYIRKIPALSPDYKRPPRSYDELQKALPFCKSFRNVSCRRRSCSGSCVVTTTPNFHLFIDLPQGSPQSSIDAIPKSIQRESDYRLAGIIAYAQDRYVGYCWTPANWVLYDGHSTAVQTVSGSAKIQPKAFIYVVKESQPSQ